MVACLTWLEEELFDPMPLPPRRSLTSRPDLSSAAEEGEENFEHWSAKELSIRAINSTLALAQEVGKLAGAVAELQTRLHTDYEDTKTIELRTLRAKANTADEKDKWFKRIMTAVVTAVVVAEALRLAGLGH